MSHALSGGAAYNVWAGVAYNPASQVVAETRDNDAYAWTGHYAVNRGYTTNGLNQYSAAGGVSFSYDANGNLTSDGANTFVYDIENRLVGASGAHSAALIYDPLGRLWQSSGAGAETVRRLYDGDALIAEYDGTGAMLARYVHVADAGDNPMIWYGGSAVSSANRRYLIADRQGSIVAITDSNGTPLAINRYDEYGVPAPGNQGRFQYTGQAWMPELGMYYYKARIYSPTLGRFLQTDPIGYKDQFNLYAYVRNDPVNGADPTGTSCIPVGDAGRYYCEVDFVMEPDGTRRFVNNDDLARLGPVNERYTAAVNHLLTNPDTVAAIPDLEGNQGGFTITAGEVAQALISRQFTFLDQNTESHALLVTQGLPDENGKVDFAETFVTRDGLAAQEVDLVHDGIHSTTQEASGGLLRAGYPLNRIPHDPQYDRASCKLLGRENTCAR